MGFVTNGAVFAAGLVLLGWSADILIKSAVKLARVFRLSDLFVGLILVAFGTSVPEAAVSLMAVFRHQPEIALGNVIGSNIANIGLILGLTGALWPVAVPRGVFRAEVPFLLAGTLGFWFLAADGLLSRLDGVLLIAAFAIFVIRVYKGAQGAEEARGFEFRGFFARALPPPALIGIFAVSLVFLTAAAHLMVASGVNLARLAGVPPWLVAVTLFAVGTSLPELAACVSAQIHKTGDVTVGNIIGSNIFNIFFVIGGAAIFRPLPVDPAVIRFDFPIMAAFAFVGVVLMRWGYTLSRVRAGFLLVLYLGFVGVLLARGAGT